MALIRIQAVLDTDNLPPEFVDLTDSDTGLSDVGYEALMGIKQVPGLEHEGNLTLASLMDVEFDHVALTGGQF